MWLEQIHTEEKPFSCQYCNNKFNSMGNKRHEQIVHSIKTPSCKFCDIFFLIKEFWINMKRMEGRYFLANILAKNSIPLEVLEDIVERIRCGKNPFSCFCGQTFSNRGNMNRLPIQPIYLKNGPNGLNWRCCLAGSSKMAPRILIFSIAMGAKPSF